ncbi:hypothetical protein OO013_19955 [Mangrovivirga sp. M17]|uniref:Ankyrin repeat domain-containing protein n=1 Tax=Mangrovivirga halotolerans TaxID=2993936 RepID=A0ABT3RWL2_9BACT|nr:hypothetical protein [Mangrovivirga halotolerans]MCX2746164.1 hypothetical protein [Mangrovivirga halotolerans]
MEKNNIGLSGYIHQGNLDQASRLILNGADINEKYDFEVRPIIAAINSDKLEVLQFVIDQGADVNIDMGEPTRIMIDYIIDSMIQSERYHPYPEDLEKLNLLINNGANIKLKDNSGNRPIDVLKLYGTTDEALTKLKSIFRPIIPDIDDLI